MRGDEELRVNIGSSPRVRGTGQGRCLRHRPVRVIPAGAGNRWRGQFAIGRSAGHPRGCGEQPPEHPVMSFVSGSSPRVRGTAAMASGAARRVRVIPAGAGNSLALPGPHLVQAGHPRGCGEQLAGGCSGGGVHGSSPRVRGTDNLGHLRGQADRVIPAGAGNRPTASSIYGPKAGHPRGCGEQPPGFDDDAMVIGSSPRVRGTVAAVEEAHGLDRVIPAGAGNSCPLQTMSKIPPGHPRGCGEQLHERPKPQFLSGSSPRVRGTVAWAGSM